MHPTSVRYGHHTPPIALSSLLFSGIILFCNTTFPVQEKCFHCLRNYRTSPWLFLPHQSIFLKLCPLMKMIVFTTSLIHSKLSCWEKNHWECNSVLGTKKKRQNTIFNLKKHKQVKAGKIDDNSVV